MKATMSYLYGLVFVVLVTGCKDKKTTESYYNPYVPVTTNTDVKEDKQKKQLKNKYPKTYTFCKAKKSNVYTNDWLRALSRGMGYSFKCHDLLKNLDKKSKLDLSRGNLNDEQIHLIGEFTQIEEINLSDNKITRMTPIIVAANHRLRIIDLTNNPITDLSGLEKFTKLDKIRLHQNTILRWTNGVNGIKLMPNLYLFSIEMHINNSRISENFYNTFRQYILHAPINRVNDEGFSNYPPYHHYLTNTPYNQNRLDRNGRTLLQNNLIEEQNRRAAALDAQRIQQEQARAQERERIQREQRAQLERQRLQEEQEQQRANEAAEQQRIQEQARAQEERERIQREQNEQLERQRQQAEQRIQEEQANLRIQARGQQNQLHDDRDITYNFMREGKFQHIIWFSLAKLDEPNLSERQRQEHQRNIEIARARLSEIFLNTPMENLVIEDFPHGTHQKYEVTFDQHVKAIFKIHGPFQNAPIVGNKSPSNAMAEFISYKIDEVLDLRMVPFTVMRELTIHGVNVLGSLQLKIDGLQFDFNQLADNNQELEIIQAIDYILGNADRFNNGNLMTINFLGHPKMVAIDFSEAFTTGHGGLLVYDTIYNGRNIRGWDIHFNGNFDGDLNQPMLGNELHPNLMPDRVKNKMNTLNYENDLLPLITQATFVNPNYRHVPHTKDLLLGNIRQRFQQIKERLNQ